MFIKCDGLHSTNMEPLKCDKVYIQFIFFKECLQIASNCVKSPTNNNNTFSNGFLLS